MKTDQYKKKLTLEKIKIAKLENYEIIVGGAPIFIPSPLKTENIKECITSTITSPIGTDI